jgi:hypothetical protein
MSGMGNKVSGCAMKLRPVVSPRVACSQSARGSLLRYPLEHGPRLEDEGRQGHSTEIGTWPQLGDDMGEDCPSSHQPLPLRRRSEHMISERELDSLLPCSGSTT